MALDDKPSKQKYLSEPPAMDERELLAILRAEEVDASSYYTSELAKDQAEAMDRYYAKQYGDEVQDRSKITTHDVENALNWVMPDLMRVFWNSDSLVNVNSSNPQDDDDTEMIADCLTHVFMQDNNGRSLLHDFAFDGLLQRLGVMAVRWKEPEPEPPQELEGVPVTILAKYINDPEYEILGASQDGETEPDQDDEQPQQAQPAASPQQPGQQPQGQGAPAPAQTTPVAQTQPTPTFTLKVQRTPRCGRVNIEVVPPEEFAISRRARSIETSAYHRRTQEMYLGDVIEMFPDARHELDPDQTSTGEVKRIDYDSDPRVLARFQNESVSTSRESSNHSHRKKIELLTEYIRVDYDNDGVVELRQVKRVNEVILENIRVDESEFVAWSPIRISHKLVGRSLADQVIDIQRITTVVTRRMMDSLDQSLLTRFAYDKSMDPEDVDALVDAQIGGVVGTKGDPAKAIMPLTTPDITPSGFQMLEYWERKKEQATGVSNDAHSMAPNAGTDTAQGLAQLAEQAGERIELVARWLSEALERILKRALKLLCDHQDGPRWIKIRGKPVEMDPRTWADDLSVSVHVAMAAANRQTMLSNLAGIAAKQEQAIMQAGPDNPICDVKMLAHTYSKMVETMGFRDTSKFFKSQEMTEQFMAQQAQKPPPPDPKMMEVQQQGQIEQQKIQQQAQANQAELQLKQQSAQQDAALAHQTAQAKASMDEQIAAQRVQAETQMAAAKLHAETTIAEQKMQAEIALAREKMMMEHQLAIEQAARDHEMAKQKHERDHEFRMKSLSLKGQSLTDQSGVKMSTGSGEFSAKT